MSVADTIVPRLDGIVQTLHAVGRRLKTSSYPSSAVVEPLPIKLGPGANSGIILRSETFLELGSPAIGSCAFTFCSKRSGLIQDGRIRLVGPDVSESAGASLPFGQVILAGGEGLSEADQQILAECQYVADEIEGYMVRSATGRVWSKVSKVAAGKGFSFDVLGRALMDVVRRRIPQVESVEVLFLTSAKEDLQSLQPLADESRDFTSRARAKVLAERGIDVSQCSEGHCGSCADKSTCDGLRGVLALRRSLPRCRETE